MKQKELNKIARNIAQSLAVRRGFQEAANETYSKTLGEISFVFWFGSGIRMGVGELTLNVGIEIPALKALITRVAGPEKGDLPCFGGPVFRFVDLSKKQLHDYVIKVRDHESEETISSQITVLWNEVAEPFFATMSSSSKWVEIIETFLLNNRLGPILGPVEGRISIAVIHATSGKNVAARALERLGSMGYGGRPVQDFNEACELHKQLSADSTLLAGLQQVIDAF